jgi:hypothetical protein
MLCPFNKSCLRRRQSPPPGSTITSSGPSSYFDPSSSSSDSGYAFWAVHPHHHLISPIPYFRSFSSGSEDTYTSTPAPSSSTASFSPTSQPQPSTLFSTGLSTSTPSFSTTRSRPSSYEPPSSSTPPPTPSSDFLFSTFTSSFVSEVNGSPTTASLPLHFFHLFFPRFIPFFFDVAGVTGPTRAPTRCINFLKMKAYSMSNLSLSSPRSSPPSSQLCALLRNPFPHPAPPLSPVQPLPALPSSSWHSRLYFACGGVGDGASSATGRSRAPSVSHPAPLS